VQSLGYRLDFSLFTELRNDESWSFRGLTQKDTNYITHCYHRYPAKFIPQLARRIIEENTSIDDTVLDPFCGSGSAVLESLLSGRIAYGSDINPLAFLITKAKTTPINPDVLANSIEYLFSSLKYYSKESVGLPKGISNWFPADVIPKLDAILCAINSFDSDIKTFFLCAFSQILKACSYWSMYSIKPYKEHDKFAQGGPDAVEIFRRHVSKMQSRNEELYNILPDIEDFNSRKRIEICDARRLPIKDKVVSLVVTSPPYVTSYEYADIHQLTLMWLGKIFPSEQIRKTFIGSISRKDSGELLSYIAYDIVQRLSKVDASLGRSVSAYFSDMQSCFKEMLRVLKTSGRAAIVIGNTTLRGVEISNAQVFVEMFSNMGLSLKNVISREVPSKYLPSIRDPSTGRFISAGSSNKVLAYPHEYILLFGN
jgi:DNA modification methylase